MRATITIASLKQKQVWLAMLIAAVVVMPRSILIMRAHTDHFDDQAHLRRGMNFLMRNPSDMYLMMNDPPLGSAIGALPMLVTGCWPGRPIDARHWPRGKAALDESTPANPQM